MTRQPARRAIELRLADAGLPALPRRAWLELDLDALRGNLALIRELAGPGVPVRPVVKADAYGHGAVPVARALEAAGADGFCVAAVDEALELRDGGRHAPRSSSSIRSLGRGPPTRPASASRSRWGDGRGVSSLVDAGAALDGDPTHSPSSWRSRPGSGAVVSARPSSSPPRGRCRRCPGIALTGLWTHFQAVEDAAITATQIERFEAAVRALAGAGVDLPARHAAASAGLLTGDVLAYDGVRPGLAIYGLVPDELDATAAQSDPAATACARSCR